MVKWPGLAKVLARNFTGSFEEQGVRGINIISNFMAKVLLPAYARIIKIKSIARRIESNLQLLLV